MTRYLIECVQLSSHKNIKIQKPQFPNKNIKGSKYQGHHHVIVIT
jgi:hypothetical protein